MKLYHNLFNAVAEILQEIFRDNRYADKALERAFKSNPRWGSRDRKFVAEAVYDIVRYFRLYCEVAETRNNYWHITAAWIALREDEIPDWPEFRNISKQALQKKMQMARSSFVLRESIPDWLDELGRNELGSESWEKEISAMNQQASVYLRVNTLKTSREKTMEALRADNIVAENLSGIDDALVLQKRTNIFQNNLFRDGWFEVQDAGSQVISLFTAPAAGEFVIDACAGAGGKSLHLAALMRNKGRITSMDVEGWKLEELKKRAKRAGVSNLDTRVIEGPATIKSLAGKADRLLLDVPCSGLGVLKRNPDAKWKLSAEVIAKTKKIQQDILQNYPDMLKAGGTLIYSTCSILPSENVEQVKAFLAANKHFRLVKEKTLLPSEGFDGFYMAMMQKEK